MPYRCKRYQKPLSLKFGTKIQRSLVPLHKWAAASTHDLIKPSEILVTRLSLELRISENCAQSLLNKIRKSMMTDNVPNEFKVGKVFRLEFIHYKGIESTNRIKTKRLKNQVDSAEFVVVCITEFNSD